MTRHLLLASLLALALPASAALTQERAPQCRNMGTMGRCPDTGCGGRGADPLLNRAKNRTDDADNPEEMTLGRIRQLREPDTWPAGQERSSLAPNEGRAVVVTGIIGRARLSEPESTNCGLTGDADRDIHIDLLSRRGDPGATSVAAEITPRIRRNHDGWTVPKLRALVRRAAFVRVTGWLMLDTQHVSRPLRRATNWEVHPVTEFEVCTLTVARCRQGDGWVTLDDFRP